MDPEAGKSVLWKGLQFGFLPKCLDYTVYMVLFEMLLRDIKFVNFQNNLIKSKLLDTAFSFFNFYKRKNTTSEAYFACLEISEPK